MAIDGYKIIDSDSAYDIHNSIIQMYDDGKDIEEIRKIIENEKNITLFQN